MRSSNLGKNQRLAALCSNRRPGCDLGLDVRHAPSQDRRFPVLNPEMAGVCWHNRNRVRECDSIMSAAGAVAQAEVLGAPRPFLRRALRPGSGSPYASSNCALAALRGTGWS